MCGMCGLWGNVEHWSSSSSRAFTGTGRRADASVVRERMLQARTINSVTAAIGVNVEDWASSTWIIKNAFGAIEIVDSLPKVWRSAESLSGKRIDPLSLAVIQKLEHHQHAASHDPSK